MINTTVEYCNQDAFLNFNYVMRCQPFADSCVNATKNLSVTQKLQKRGCERFLYLAQVIQGTKLR